MKKNSVFFDKWINFLNADYLQEINALFDISQLENNLEDALEDKIVAGIVDMTKDFGEDFFGELRSVITNALEMNFELSDEKKRKLLDLLLESLNEFKEDFELVSALEANRELKYKLKENPPEIIDTRSEETKRGFSTGKL